MDDLTKSVEKLEVVQTESENDNELSKKILDELQEHSSRGNAAAQFTLGQYYLKNNDASSAFSLFEQSAASNYSQAIYQLGVMYYDGIGVHSDPEKGFELMLKIALSKDKEDKNLIPAAQFNVGKAYYQGFGVKQSDEEAVKWWTLSANGGPHGNTSSVRSMNTLALFYVRPENIDKQKAFYWHEKAADQDHADSIAALGLMYTKGEGCPKDKESALRLLKKSADKGSVYGAGMLTHYYYSAKLYSKAIEVAQRLCDLKAPVDEIVQKTAGHAFLIRKGLATAYYIYAHCSRFGQGTTKNDPEAAIWYEKAKSADPNTVFELHKLVMSGRL